MLSLSSCFFEDLHKYSLIHIGRALPNYVACKIPSITAHYTRLSSVLKNVPVYCDDERSLCFITHHAFSCASVDERVLFFQHYTERACVCIFIEYTLSERVLEYIFSWWKYCILRAYGIQWDNIVTFFNAGGMEGILYTAGIPYKRYARTPLTQCAVYVCEISHTKERVRHRC